MMAWREAGIDIVRTSAGQYATLPHYPFAARQPGDLIFYQTGGTVTHVTMYVGNGLMIEAPHTGLTVRQVAVRTSGVMAYVGRPTG